MDELINHLRTCGFSEEYLKIIEEQSIQEIESHDIPDDTYDFHGGFPVEYVTEKNLEEILDRSNWTK